MARPKKEIDQKQFEVLCSIQCTEQEICAVLDVTDKTLTRWCNETYNLSYSEVYKTKSAYGKMSLRRYQFELAKTNAAMAIFLGKQYLGQRDIVGVETDDTTRECTSELIKELKRQGREAIKEKKDGESEVQQENN